MAYTYMRPNIGFAADLIKFVPHFRRLAVSWTARGATSEGMERFVDEFLPKIRANNPQIEYALYRTHTPCDPFVVGTYHFNRMRKMRCTNRTAEQILAMVEQMSVGGDFRPGRRRGVSKKLPRGLELWDTETMGHDVFKVLSKYKPDPANPNEITSLKHPNLTYRFRL
ncbi:hypothetical protein M3Y94_01156700 [Aphelenchoides besseyi]|nr:hypothetical protein M3Y94_01156700 [Aphelenchoides besseyi]KAI6228021.1 hypothetical protein M3Y95_00578400 [Aphelenchoides besseyi]